MDSLDWVQEEEEKKQKKKKEKEKEKAASLSCLLGEGEMEWRKKRHGSSSLGIYIDILGKTASCRNPIWRKTHQKSNRNTLNAFPSPVVQMVFFS